MDTETSSSPHIALKFNDHNSISLVLEVCNTDDESTKELRKIITKHESVRTECSMGTCFITAQEESFETFLHELSKFSEKNNVLFTIRPSTSMQAYANFVKKQEEKALRK